MKKYTLLALSLLAFVVVGLTARAQNADFVIKKVDVDFVPTPDFQVNGPNPIRNSSGSKKSWVKIDVTFDANPEFTEEVTLNYYALLFDQLLTGRVNHINVTRGRDLHSVMFISPQALDRIAKGSKALNRNSFTNIAVTAPGGSVGHFKPGARGEWWAGPDVKPVDGILLNKSDTPFAPLGWDYYEATKPASAR